MFQNRPRVLVTGASGFVGRAVCEELRARDYRKRLALRPPQDRLEGRYWSRDEAVEVDTIDGATDWRAALDSVELVIHLAARVHVHRERSAKPLSAFRRVNVDGSRRLAELCAEVGVRRFVFLSTVGIHGRSTQGAPFRETDAPAPGNPYSVSKLEAEEAIAQSAEGTGMELVIARAPMVYGPYAAGNFRRLAKAVVRGYPLPLASIRNARSFVGVGNLAAFLVDCLEYPDAPGEVFLVADDETPSTPGFVRLIAGACGAPARLVSVPERLLRAAGALAGKGPVIRQLCDSLVVDCSKARDLLGWRPRYSLSEELLRSRDWLWSLR